MRRVEPFPWDRLERVDRAAARTERRVRRTLERVVKSEALATALTELLSSEVELRAAQAGAATETPDPARSVHLESGDGVIRLAIVPEPSLVTAALGRLLGRAPNVTDPGATLAPAVRGALSALLVEAARRTESEIELRARSDAPGDCPSLRVDATVAMDGRPYGVRVYATVHGAPRIVPVELRRAGALPVGLPIVAAVSVAARAELEALAPGDVWLPGAGWFAPRAHDPAASTRSLLERAALSAPLGEIGVEVGCSDDGRLVLRRGTHALTADVNAENFRGDRTMSESNDTLTALALDAPVVVRVEIGSVTLSARDWAMLRPGDVLETGLSLDAPIVLRVAGREVARGELVRVDDELGVRVREIVSEGAA